ncbi:hypothetical protein [Vibrio crassostreae]|uniref:hypothetical protein n=1 Tax=Vibrio crassostreae TaxID=246167 RepID=UPI001B313D56|nr:hypothetical protein [Vibrio crassostreae]
MLKMITYPSSNGSEVIEACKGKTITLYSIKDVVGKFSITDNDVYRLKLGDNSISTPIDIFPDLGVAAFAGCWKSREIQNEHGQLTENQSKWLKNFEKCMSFVPDGLVLNFGNEDAGEPFVEVKLTQGTGEGCEKKSLLTIQSLKQY